MPSQNSRPPIETATDLQSLALMLAAWMDQIEKRLKAAGV